MDSLYIHLVEKYEFVIKLLEKISEKRGNRLFINRCKSMKDELETLKTKRDFLPYRIDLFQMIDELKFIIQAEIRFFLFPLQDIKQETFEMGKRYMNNFLEWFRPEEDVAVEDILNLLKDEIYLLDEAKRTLEKISVDQI